MAPVDPAHADGPAQGQERWPRIRKWAKAISVVIAALGVVSAGIGYITNGFHFFTGVADYFQDTAEQRSLIATADDRLAHLDFEAAWAANAKARELSPRNEAASVQQSRIAMKWLENARVSSASGPKTFSELVAPLKSVLVERVPMTQGAEKADLQAHIGWANFLRYRDGQPATDIIEEFDTALTTDPGNVYGHAMRGFWILWNGGPVDKARADLEMALQSGADTAFSDMLIMSGLLNNTSDPFITGAIEFAEKVHKAGRNINDAMKDKLLWYYTNALRDNDLLTKITQTVPEDAQISLLMWLKEANVGAYPKRVATYFTARFSERAHTDEALRLYRELIRSAEPGRDDVTDFAERAVVRLSGK